ncbi:MAG TPA: MerR family transcriptional regulator [Pyrinomonadaceae bacterium]
MLKTASFSGEDRGRSALRIGEVAKASGLGVETLRFYERRGLLGRPRRTAANYRVYDDSVLERLAFIRRAQAIGFSLDEIQTIIAESEDGRRPCGHVRELARRKLSELDERLRELRAHRGELARLLGEWDERGEEAGQFCGLIEHSRIEARKAPVRSLRAGKNGGRR